MPRTEVTGSQIKDASVSLTADVTGTLPVANGGTGSTTIALNNVMLGNGTGAIQTVAPGTSGNLLTSNGTTWSSTTPSTFSQLVCTTAAGGTGAEDGANTWCKIATVSAGSSAGVDMTVYLACIGTYNSNQSFATLCFGVRTNASPSNPNTTIYLLSAVSPSGQILSDSFKLINNGFGTNVELWMKKGANFGRFRFYEIGENPYSSAISIAYNDGGAWQSATPTGTAGNVSTTGVFTAAPGTANGSVVTVDASQTLSGKTLSAGTLTGTTVNAQNGIIESYNTADQTTNYEKVVHRWNSNVAEIAMLFGGTGTARAVTIGVSSGAGNTTVGRSLTVQNSVPFVSCTSGGSGNGSTASNGAHIRWGSTSSQLTASSLHQTVCSVAGNIGQSGTASYTGLLVDVTETSTGSGTKHLINAQVGGSSKFLVDNAGAITSNGVAVPTISSTSTLTSKRITPRVTTTNAPGATPTVATDSWDQVNFTGLATAITSMTTNLTGTPTDGQMLTLRFKDDGTGRAITWGASYTSAAATLPTTTVANKTHLVRFLYDSAASKWACVSADATGY